MSTPTDPHSSSLAAFRAGRRFLLDHREEYQSAYQGFTWPDLGEFNWALDWFDSLATDPEFAGATALWIIEPDGSEAQWSFGQLSIRSNQVANWLRSHGVVRGDRLVLMLSNQLELWETILAAMKLGAVIIPATPLLSAADLADRVNRGGAAHVVVATEHTGKFTEVSGDYTRIAVGGPAEGWLDFAEAFHEAEAFTPDAPTMASDPLLLYFTSGTTSSPKLVEHTHASYPVGHLSTMYWIGLKPGDVHLNISSPGWAKHAWSNVFAPWNAGACVLIYNYTRFEPAELLDQLVRCDVDVLCAPPTVWRMLIQADLAAWNVGLREIVGAGEPLNPEIIETVEQAWGIPIRDGFGQTETTAQIGNSPGQPVKPGSMGRPLPGYPVVLVDQLTGEPAEEGADGEICLDLAQRPLGLMPGYADDPARHAEAMRDGYYHTGDVGSRDGDGYITYVGRTDDLFKASDYRISPFELESVLLEHAAVAEVAVVPSPEPVRLAVPKAYVLLAPGYEPGEQVAREILQFARYALAPYKRVRRLEFAELPKTISGKIRRVQLRERESEVHANGAEVAPEEYWASELGS